MHNELSSEHDPSADGAADRDITCRHEWDAFPVALLAASALLLAGALARVLVP